MRKKLVNEKRAELKQLSNRELIDRILSYPNQELLNRDEEGNRRPFPVGQVAKHIQDHQYQMTENQYYALIHNFAGITVPEMKVVGVSFRENPAETFEKELITKTGVKSVYETDYHLVPEPDNPYDANAVKVMVRKTDQTMHQIGYLNREFVAAHPITEELDVKGYLTDHSNGHFKNVSYSLAVDTEHLDRHQADLLSLTDADLQGIGDLSLDQKKADPKTYEAPFQLRIPVNDFESARAYLTEEDMTEYLTDAHPELNGLVTRVEWDLMTEESGVIRVETTNPLTPESSQKISDWISGQCSDGLGEGFEQQPFAEEQFEGMDEEYDIDPEMASFDWETNPYHLQDVTPPPKQEQETGVRYERPFQTNGKVLDLADANAQLKDLSNSVLSENLKADLLLYGQSEIIQNVGWEFLSPTEGRMYMECSKPLSSQGAWIAERWAEYQQQDGNVRAAVQELPCASCDVRKSFFQPGTEPMTRLDQKPEIQAKEIPDLQLQEGDLDFARQMDFSDFGI